MRIASTSISLSKSIYGLNNPTTTQKSPLIKTEKIFSQYEKWY
jgi:hypothetical protein